MWARRETLQEEVSDAIFKSQLDLTKWPSIQPGGLSPIGMAMQAFFLWTILTYSVFWSTAVERIVEALSSANFPLIIAANSGRNPRTVPLLTALCRSRSIAVYTSVCAALCIPHNEPYLIGSSVDGKNAFLELADVVILLEVGVPWIEASGTKLRDGARAFIIDSDPLKHNYGWSHVDAEMICTADAETALGQLVDAIRTADLSAANTQVVAQVAERRTRIQALHDKWMSDLAAAEAVQSVAGGIPSVHFILGALRDAVVSQTPSRGEKVLWLNEAISKHGEVWNHIQPVHPGSMITSGASSLGWALGAAVGARLGAQVAGIDYDLVAAVVGDGTYLFGVPSTAYWMARRYNTVRRAAEVTRLTLLIAWDSLS